MKRYVIFHSQGVAFADGLHEAAEFISYLDCRHCFIYDTLDEPAVFVEMVRSLEAAMDWIADLDDGYRENSGDDADRR